MNFSTLHSLNGSETFLDKTVADIGIPPLHIVCGRIGSRARFFEFTADYDEIFAGLGMKGSTL